jgi:hypothetical protein
MRLPDLANNIFHLQVGGNGHLRLPSGRHPEQIKKPPGHS